MLAIADGHFSKLCVENIRCANMHNINIWIGHKSLSRHRIWDVAVLCRDFCFLDSYSRYGICVTARGSDCADMNFTNKSHANDASIVLGTVGVSCCSARKSVGAHDDRSPVDSGQARSRFWWRRHFIGVTYAFLYNSQVLSN